MSKTFYITRYGNTILEKNLTGNLYRMAFNADLEYLWTQEKTHIKRCRHLIPYLKRGIRLLTEYPEKFKQMNPPNEQDSYDVLLAAAKEILSVCEAHPMCKVQSR